MRFKGRNVKEVTAHDYASMPDNLSLYLIGFLSGHMVFFKTDATLHMISFQLNHIEYAPYNTDDQEYIDSIDFEERYSRASDGMESTLDIDILERRLKHKGKFFKLIGRNSAEKDIDNGENFYFREKRRGSKAKWHMNTENPLLAVDESLRKFIRDAV